MGYTIDNTCSNHKHLNIVITMVSRGISQRQILHHQNDLQIEIVATLRTL